MTKSIIPAAAIIAVAPAVAQAAPVAPEELGPDVTAALAAFDASTLKQNLYTVINTIGEQGSSEGYVKAVKDVYLVQTSALENEIEKYNQGILAGNYDAAAAKAKHDEFQAQIEKIAKDAADMQKPYAEALEAAKAAVEGADTTATDVKAAIDSLDVPAVKEEFEKKFEELMKDMPAEPTSAENKDANDGIKNAADDMKAKLEQLQAEAAKAVEDAKVAQNLMFADLMGLKTDLVKANTAASTEIAGLIANTGIENTYAINNDTTYAKDISEWWEEVEAAQKDFTLDAKDSLLTKAGNDIKANIANNLDAAKAAAKTAEDTEYTRIQGLIKDETDKYALVAVDEKDTQSAKYVTDYETKLSVAELGAKGFHDAGTSVVNKETNEANVDSLATSIENLEKSVASYGFYTQVKDTIQAVQDKYNEDILRLTEKLAGKETYQDVYEQANKGLNDVATLIQQVTNENEALYVAEPSSEEEDYAALIEKIKGQEATKAVDEALDLYEGQEAAKAVADTAVVKAKDGVTDQVTLDAIKGVEDVIAGEYAKHDLAAEDYEGLLQSVNKYAEQRAMVAALDTIAITADSVVFAADIKAIKDEIVALGDTVAAKYAAGETEAFATELETKIGEINAEITKLNADAAAELKAKDEDLAIIDGLKSALKAADDKIKLDYTLVYADFEAQIKDLQKKIDAEEKLVKDAYTADAEADAENSAVRNLDLSTFKAETEAAINDLLKAAGGSYNDRIDKANEASLNQMNADVAKIQKKVDDTETELKKYFDEKLGGPDFAEEIEALNALIDAQVDSIAKYKAAWEADTLAGVHEPTLVSKLETVDQEFFGESYPLTNKEEGGIWKKADDLLKAAQLNKEAYERELKKVAETAGYVPGFINTISNTLTYLTDEQEQAYLKLANDYKQATKAQVDSINENYVAKKAVEYEKEVADLNAKIKKDLTENDYKDEVTSALEAAMNDNEYDRIVAAIESAHDTYINAIDSARVDWATQYSKISGVYADATGIEDYKEDLDKALAAYQKELSTDITKLNELKGMVGTAYEAALADAKECYEKIDSRNCTADAEYDDVYTKDIKDVNEHINTTEQRATENLNAFKQQIAYVGVKDAEGDYTEGSLLYNYNRGIEELAKAEEAVLNGTTDQKPVLDADGNQVYDEDGNPKFETKQYSSEELAKAKEELEKIKAQIDTLEANIRAQHIALDAANYGTAAADKYAELTAAMKDLRSSSVTSYNAEVAKFNQAVLDYTTKYGDEVKKVYDEYITSVAAYDSYQHEDYSQYVSDVQDIFFGLADSLRAIVADAKTACADSTSKGKYFDVKELTHWLQLDEVKEAMDVAYNDFLATTEKIAEAIAEPEFAGKAEEIEEAKKAVEAYGNDAALKELDEVSKAFVELGEKAEKDVENNVLPQNLDSYLEALNGIDVAGAWNDAAKVYGDSIIGVAQALVDEFAGTQYIVDEDTTAYGKDAQAIIDAAVIAAQATIDSVKVAEGEAYADAVLPENLEDILAKLEDIEGNLDEAKTAADEKQKEVNENAENKATYDAILVDYNALVQKYKDAVTTIAGYDDEVQSQVDMPLKAIGGNEKNAEGGQINDLKCDIDESYADNDWTNLDEYKDRITEIGEKIDKILAKAAEKQANIDANSDYAKVSELYDAAYALVEPYNRAEVNKGTTEAAIAEASDIYKTLAEYLKNFSGATNAFDEATTDEEKEAANKTLKAYADAEEFWQGKIDELAERIEALDVELTAFNKLAEQLEQLDADLDALEVEIYELANGEKVVEALDGSDVTKAFQDAYEAAEVAIGQSHALNRADQDAEELQGKIDAAKKALEAVREEAKAIDQALTAEAAKAENDAAYETLNAQVNEAYSQLNAVWKKINKDLTDVQAADYMQQYNDAKAAIDAVKQQLDADNKAIALTAESKVDLTAAEDAIKALNDVAEAAQKAAEEATQKAQEDVAKANADLNEAYDKALEEIQNILVPGIEEEYEQALAEIKTDVVDPENTTTATKEADLQKIQEVKDAIDQVVADAKAAVEKFESKGNLNGGQLNATDYGILVDYVTGYLTPDDEQFYLADVNCDGELDVADLTNLVNIILGKTDIYEINGYGVARAKAINDINSDITASASVSNNRLGIALTGNVDIVAMQADVTIPEGTTVNQILSTMRSKGLNVYSNNLEDNVVRVVLASADNNVISGNEGDVLTMALTGSTSDITIDNIKVADADGNSYKLEALAAGEATGIKGITADELKGARIFDAAGVETGKLGKGANIIVKANGEKITVVK